LFNVCEFSDHIKAKLGAKYDWAKGMCFMVQIKGIKEAHQHNPINAEDELEHLLSDFNMRTGQWSVDVGLEVSEPEMAYRWTTEGQATVVKHAV
jgi:hypothetical protein